MNGDRLIAGQQVIGPSDLQQSTEVVEGSSTAKKIETRGGVTAADIIACIEMLLGRTPDHSLVQYHLELGFADRFALGTYMINTGEFQARVAEGTRVQRLSPVYLGDRIFAVTHRGHIIYLIPSDLDLTPAIMRKGTWEVHVEQTIASLVRPGDTVIDIGANVGYHTLAIAATVGPSGRVHAFEANPDVMRLLNATMFTNGFSTWQGTGPVSLYQTAVLDKPGIVTLASAPGHYGSGHVINEMPASDLGPAYSTRVEVPAIALDDELGDRVGTADLIHMDIEGSEPLALYGASKLIERSPQIKIVTEWSVGMMSARANLEEFVIWLVGLGFKFFRIKPSKTLLELPPAALLTLAHCDLLLSRQDHP